MKLILFDLDNTLLAGDSDYEWGQFLIDRGIVDRDRYEHQNQVFYQQYKAGTLNIHEFLDFQLLPLAQNSHSMLQSWHDEFMQTKIQPMISKAARDLVDQALNEADLVSIITATNSFVTAPIARAFGVTHLIATDPEQINGEFTGKVSGIPSFREGKVIRLHQWLESIGKQFSDFDDSWFYSDSHNDLPLLELVNHPVVVNADPILHAHALAHGWPNISLGKNTP